MKEEKLNEEGAPNLNLGATQIKNSNLIPDSKGEHPFSEEISDGYERDRAIFNQVKKDNK